MSVNMLLSKYGFWFNGTKQRDRINKIVDFNLCSLRRMLLSFWPQDRLPALRKFGFPFFVPYLLITKLMN